MSSKPSTRKSAISIKLFERNEWDIFVDGNWAGSLERSKPQRLSHSGASLYCVNSDAPWSYGVRLSCGELRPLPSGITCRTAKALAVDIARESNQS